MQGRSAFWRPGLYRPVAHLLLALPLSWLLLRWGYFASGVSARDAGLTSNPIDHSIDYLGLWALRALLLTLCISPLARWGRLPGIMAARRPVGLWAFAYAVLHLSLYFGLDLLGDPAALWEEVAKHRFILFGMAAFVAIVPLAITSTHGWIRRLGGRRWQRLHRLIYPAVLLGCVHFILRVKGFQLTPWLYAGIVVLLLCLRCTPILARRGTR